jgi:GNAT superfamily N-acetyltransferase
VTVSLRRATADDAPAVRDLFCRSFTATFGHLYPPQELADWLAGCSLERFMQECGGADHACMLGIATDGRLLGYCTLGPQDLPVTSDRPWWVLRQLYLEEEAKGTGLAHALLAWAIAEARARGFSDLCLTVWIDNHRARRFYERHGFEEIGRYAFRVGSTVDDDRILRRAL